MRLYAIHAPKGPDVEGAPERAWASRTGFSFAGLVFGPLWLIARAMWWELAVYALAAAMIVAMVFSGGLWPGAAIAAFSLGHLYLAIDGRSLAVAARARRGRPLVDLIYARSAMEAEKAYLDRELASAPASAPRGAGRGGADIIGLFPEPGR